MNSKIPAVVAALLAVAVSLPSWTAHAQDESPTVLVIGDVSCRDVLLQTGADQERTISFLHGYAAGAAGRSQIDVEALATATGRFLEACIEAPDESALAMLQDILR